MSADSEKQDGKPPRHLANSEGENKRSFASRKISIERDDQQVTDEAMRSYADGTHMPWDQAGAQSGVGRSEKRIRVLGLMILIACALAIVSIRKPSKTTAEQEAIRPVTETVVDIPQSELRGAVLAIFKVLCESGDTRKILSVVRHADEIESKVLRYYQKHPPQTRLVDSVDLDLNSAIFSSEQRSLVKVVVTFEDQSRRSAAVEWTRDQVRVDWEHWQHYQPLPLEEFASGEMPPTEEKPIFRVGAREPRTFRSMDGLSEASYRSVILRDPATGSDDFPAYLVRGSDTDRKLIRLVRDGPEITIMLELQRDRKGVVWIKRLVSESWI